MSISSESAGTTSQPNPGLDPSPSSVIGVPLADRTVWDTKSSENYLIA